MIALPIPLCDTNDFSVLYHLTSFEAAEKILTSEEIFGNDTNRHANFTAIIKRPDIARHKDICLRFKWTGTQAMYFGDPFGHGEPRSNGLSKPILYHIFPDTPLLCGEQLRSKKYWQSNLYPGSSGLLFDGIEAIHNLPPAIPPKPSCLSVWNYADKLNNYRQISAHHRWIQDLKVLAMSKINCTFSVP